MPRATTSWRVSNSFAAFCKRTRGEQSDNAEPGARNRPGLLPPGERQSTDRRRPAAFGQNAACKSIAHFSDAAPTRGHTAQMLARTNPRYVISRQGYGTALDELRNLVGRCARTGYAALVGRVSAKATGRSISLTCSADLRCSQQRHWPVNLLPGAIGQANPSSCGCLTAEVCCRSMSPIAPPLAVQSLSEARRLASRRHGGRKSARMRNSALPSSLCSTVIFPL